VIGIGYVGLPSAIEFAKAGFKVTGIDKDKYRVEKVNSGKTYITGIEDKEIKAVLNTSFSAVAVEDQGYDSVSKADIIIISVPTPINEQCQPVMDHILEVRNGIKEQIRKNQLLILESTVYPGTTEEIFLSMIKERNFSVGEDYWLVFAPERINPGDKTYNLTNTPRLIGGVTEKCSGLARHLYAVILKDPDRSLEQLLPVVSSPKIAETSKLLENSYRSINIALMNEMAVICSHMNIDVWAVIEAARTKPFGFSADFAPGPGVGGHCISSDPLFLSYVAMRSGYEPKLINSAHRVNEAMPFHVVSIVIKILNKFCKCLKGAKILFIGISYKNDVNDCRESPALKILGVLQKYCAEISYYDPYISKVLIGETEYKSIELDYDLISEFDCIIITTNHQNAGIDYIRIQQEAGLIIDTRHQYNGSFINVISV
jgi:UDP-N-acetyl-D-glucosamine dehydrogenase